MFMGPLEATKPWSMTGVNGVRGFLDRVWRMIIADRSEQMELNPAVQNVPPTDEQNRVLHKTIAAVTNDLDRWHFNTAIARMMEFTNFFTKRNRAAAGGDGEVRAALVAVCAASGRRAVAGAGTQKTLAYEPWPKFDEKWLKEDTIEMPVQMNGKLRGKISVPAGAIRRPSKRRPAPMRKSRNCWPAKRS